MIISLVNNKGGVGKTTSAVNLAAGLADRQVPVLLVDLDSQASCSLSLGVPREALNPCVGDALFSNTPIEKIIHSTDVPGLELVAGGMVLANTDLLLGQAEGRESRLREVLESIADRYAFIILDCPPSLSLLSVNALVASDAHILPVVPHYLALEGLVNLLISLKRIEENIGTTSSLLGILLTVVDYRVKVTTTMVEMIRKQYGSQVFKTEVPVNIRLAEAPSFGKSIFDYDRSSTGAGAYARFCEEVKTRTRRLQ